MDMFSNYALVAAEESMQDSGLDVTKVNLDRMGVIWGSGIGGMKSFFDECVAFAKGDGTPRFNPFFVPKMIPDIAAGHISIKYGFRGVNFATVSACASSTHAIIDSFNYIRLGKADAIITGGSESPITEPGVAGFNASRALSTINDNPQAASRPYDVDRDGFVLGEGAGSLILEDLEHAQARGAKIYAEVVGGGLTADAYHITAPHPEGLGARNVILTALDDANIGIEDIDYINTHGTSTPLGDIAEIKAVKHVFGDHVYDINISSSKSMTGHLLGGAGAIEAIGSLMAIEKGIILPTINLDNLDPEIDSKLNLTANKSQKREVNYCISNTFGFGGHNASIVFKKFN